MLLAIPGIVQFPELAGVIILLLSEDVMRVPLKLVLFIDAQNTYRGARDSFFPDGGPSYYGQFNPTQLGNLIAARGGPSGISCALSEVRVYTGRPDSNRSPRTHAAHIRQCAVWQAGGAHVIARPLRYPPAATGQPPQEKGIDVALCIDFVTMAVDGHYDVGVIISTDTDLLPALDFVRSRYAGFHYVAVAAWDGRKRLSLPGANIWCHWLSQADYNAVADTTDYNR